MVHPAKGRPQIGFTLFGRGATPPFSGFHSFEAMAQQHAILIKMALAAFFMLLFILISQNLSFGPPTTPEAFATRDPQILHVLVTGGAGFIGSHAALRLLDDGHRVTIVDNLSRGNVGAVRALQRLALRDRLQFISADLGDRDALNRIFSNNAIDIVMHFAAISFVGESMADPNRYYSNITMGTLHLVEAMTRHGVNRLIYSSTCATYGEPEEMPVTEETPQLPINPYGKAKKMAEDLIRDYVKANPNFAAIIFRYFNVIGADPKGRIGEMPRPELRSHLRIAMACFDAALGNIPALKILGLDYNTADGTCVRDFIHVSDLVDAHVVAIGKLSEGVLTYNIGTGKGSSVKQVVQACLKVTGKDIKVLEVAERRPGDPAELYSNPSKIRTELNWTAQYTDLEENLRMAWNWRQQHPYGYPGDERKG